MNGVDPFAPLKMLGDLRKGVRVGVEQHDLRRAADPFDKGFVALDRRVDEDNLRARLVRRRRIGREGRVDIRVFGRFGALRGVLGGLRICLFRRFGGGRDPRRVEHVARFQREGEDGGFRRKPGVALARGPGVAANVAGRALAGAAPGGELVYTTHTGLTDSSSSLRSAHWRREYRGPDWGARKAPGVRLYADCSP